MPVSKEEIVLIYNHRRYSWARIEQSEDFLIEATYFAFGGSIVVIVVDRNEPEVLVLEVLSSRIPPSNSLISRPVNGINVIYIISRWMISCRPRRVLCAVPGSRGGAASA